MTQSSQPRIRKPSDFVDRRSAPRVETQLQIGIIHRDDVLECTTENLSLNGLMCELDNPLPLFTQYRIRLRAITQTKKDHQDLEIEGIVVRVEENQVEGTTKYYTAFYFNQLNPTARTHLEQYINDHKKTE